MNHCWEDYREWLVDNGKENTDEWYDTWHETNKTCLREHRHDGPHEWTDDHDIEVTFKA